MSANYLSQLLANESTAAQNEAVAINDVYQQRVYRGDYILAEGLTCLAGEEWEEIRTLIARGQFALAKELLNQIEDTGIEGQQEIRFEQARTALFEGDFEKTLEIAIELQKDKKLNPLTKMTTFQLEAVALFETGKTKQALEVTDRILALESIFPRSQASLFGRVTRCRALNELGNIHQADYESKELWNKISSGTYNVNIPLQLIMYFRLMCKLAIERHQNMAAYAMAGFWLSKNIGTPLHEGFFLLDLKQSEDPELRNFAKSELPSYIERFTCIKRFNQKILNSEQINNLSTGLTKYRSQRPKKILLLEERYYYDSSVGLLAPTLLHDKTFRILKYLNNRKLEKEELFKEVWEVSQFNLLLNDSSIRTALKRVREETGISVTSQNMILEIHDTIII